MRRAPTKHTTRSVRHHRGFPCTPPIPLARHAVDARSRSDGPSQSKSAHRAREVPKLRLQGLEVAAQLFKL